ncbi:hypothetical protein ACFWN1_28575 [Streptomyces sp. NPDC058459]|uniref:hypothetical protein n=1 Tax=Streptomyces sp. NPDC058459 TaxID=3346508 RepID=UPI00365F32C5
MSWPTTTPVLHEPRSPALAGDRGPGVTIGTWDARRAGALPDFAGHSTARGCGLRSAYARMVTGVLDGHDQVSLYVLQLHQGAPTEQGTSTRVAHPWDGRLPAQPPSWCTGARSPSRSG